MPSPGGSLKHGFVMSVAWHFVAAALYAAFAVYLYQPHLADLMGWQWLLPINACAAALGGYMLSRRWAAGFLGSLLAGLVYGFGPFVLGLARFHPTASLLAAGVPWLFVPAAFLERKHGKGMGLPLWLLPFAAVALFSYLSARQPLFAASLPAQLGPVDLVGFIAPLALLGRSTVLLGIYHVPVAALVLGLAMIWKARRYGILVITAMGVLLAFSGSFLDIGKAAWLGASPVLWLSIPMLWCAVLSGIGLHGLVEAGPADRKWILTAAIVLGILAIIALLLAAKCFQVFLGLGNSYGRLFLQAAELYLVGAGATGLIFFLTRQNLRVHWLRWVILGAALGLDIFLSARYLVDQAL
jgi:hypothetical protein